MEEQPLDSPTGGVAAEFGYYPKPCDLDTDRFSVRTLTNLQESIAAVADDPGTLKDWIYPGPQSHRNVSSGTIRTMPYPSRVFGLPKTHVLTVHQSTNPLDLEFVVWCLAFFMGMPLTTTEAGFLDAAPTRPGMLVDFVLTRPGGEVEAIELALDFLNAEPGDSPASKRVAAIIHALFLSHSPQSLPFERFQYLYMALDGCFQLISAKGVAKPPRRHGERIQWMCAAFDMPVPDWAKHATGAPSSLSVVRNKAFHEGLFFGEPLGFSIYGGNQPAADLGNTPLQMQALVSRLLVAILGKPQASYVKSPVNTRQHHGLNLRE
ncbi:hypothetical protein A7X93_12160 [Stenotrophomonas maltophilia]|uniref:hypothetical protein n=1 Tax=Stenotrophomonas maltophilia TaxID=40324 RepID=UPI000DAA55D5|nr:hypothetical protein [Stenotrophomonas maltophilia]PZT31022.1 hypothetical protein A7X93_12160 [Stenotrophomonas maltophilia]